MLAAHTVLVAPGLAAGAPGRAGESDTWMAALLMPLAPASMTTCNAGHGRQHACVRQYTNTGSSGAWQKRGQHRWD